MGASAKAASNSRIRFPDSLGIDYYITGLTPMQGVAAAPDPSAVGMWSPQRVSNRGNLPPRLRVEYFGPWKMWAEMPSNL